MTYCALSLACYWFDLHPLVIAWCVHSKVQESESSVVFLTKEFGGFSGIFNFDHCLECTQY